MLRPVAFDSEHVVIVVSGMAYGNVDAKSRDDNLGAEVSGVVGLTARLGGDRYRTDGTVRVDQNPDGPLSSGSSARPRRTGRTSCQGSSRGLRRKGQPRSLLRTRRGDAVRRCGEDFKHAAPQLVEKANCEPQLQPE
jgi:hypothetical protein